MTSFCTRNIHTRKYKTLGLAQDLIKELMTFGTVEDYKLLDDYPSPEFTEVLWVKFLKIQSARIAKRKMDNCNYCGGDLHVFYAPEYETVDDTRAKLQDRRRAVSWRLRQFTGETSMGEQANVKSTVETVKNYSDTVATTFAQPFFVQPVSCIGLPPKLFNQTTESTGNVCRTQQHIDDSARLDILSAVPLPHSLTDISHTLPATSSEPDEDYFGSRVSHAKRPANVAHSRASVPVLPLVVKNYKPEGSAPRFVPRQLVKRSTVSAVEKDSSVHSTDRVNEELKRTALITGSVPQGPTMPPDYQPVKQVSDTSLDRTTAAIRAKLSKFSTLAPPAKKLKKADD